MKIVPINRKILVQRIEPEEVVKGGIIIPDTAKEKPQQGKVIAVAKVSEDDEPMPVKVNDTIIFSKYAGTEIELEGEKYIIMAEDDILAIVEK
ncbi:co-chaperone GroES [candidate division TA06 bacterium]|uniref:Co-chaperonin GroES n=1 Tax=candidate division TA06 bacterium TaxID=2250710 RepID=A0A660S8Q1_UNCT6|nr:MAG: co-chaperone GroES [candidate division TA06 bacterium]